MALRSLPIRRSGNRYNLFMGGDRELVMFSGLIAGTLIFIAGNWFALIAGILFWFFAVWALRKMAKADPLMRKVYMRSRLYKKYYPPRSRHFHRNGIKQGKRYL